MHPHNDQRYYTKQDGSSRCLSCANYQVMSQSAYSANFRKLDSGESGWEAVQLSCSEPFLCSYSLSRRGQSLHCSVSWLSMNPGGWVSQGQKPGQGRIVSHLPEWLLSKCETNQVIFKQLSLDSTSVPPHALEVLGYSPCITLQVMMATVFVLRSTSIVGLLCGIRRHTIYSIDGTPIIVCNIGNMLANCGMTKAIRFWGSRKATVSLFRDRLLAIVSQRVHV